MNEHRVVFWVKHKIEDLVDCLLIRENVLVLVRFDVDMMVRYTIGTDEIGVGKVQRPIDKCDDGLELEVRKGLEVRVGGK